MTIKKEIEQKIKNNFSVLYRDIEIKVEKGQACGTSAILLWNDIPLDISFHSDDLVEDLENMIEDLKNMVFFREGYTWNDLDGYHSHRVGIIFKNDDNEFVVKQKIVTYGHDDDHQSFKIKSYNEFIDSLDDLGNTKLGGQGLFIYQGEDF